MKPRLTTIKPRLQSAPGRQLASVGEASGERAEQWGSGRGGRPWRRKRDAILLRDKYSCQQCGHIGTDLEVDHIVNVAQGGTDDDGNLQTLCPTCHKAKTATESQAGRR